MILIKESHMTYDNNLNWPSARAIGKVVNLMTFEGWKIEILLRIKLTSY